MPELPEVETVANSVKHHLINNSFNKIYVNWPKTLFNFSLTDYENRVKNNVVHNIFRRGKYIIIDFVNCIIAIHLRMTGKLYVVDSVDLDNKHISVYIQLTEKYLVFEDTRKFGRFYLYDNLSYLDNKLGIEPLSQNFCSHWFMKNIKNRSRQMKSLLLDQSFVCGIGNIYADEVLWESKINPLSISNRISSVKINKLHRAIVEVLKDSIKRGGTTIRDYTYDYRYVGNYALNLKVYGRTGENCFRCKTKIVKTTVAQRGTHFCPKCQKNYS